MKHVIIGAGAAGISAAGTLRSLDPTSEIVVISSDESVYSRCMLHKYLGHERDEESISFIPPDFFEKNGIQWIKGVSADKIDGKTREVILADGSVIPYDRLLIATGADSVIPPVGGLRSAENVFGLRHLSDARLIDSMAESAENVLIIGSGLVGMDTAYALLNRGKNVTVVEMADHIMPIQLDKTAGEPYRELFSDRGCRFICGRKASYTSSDGAKRIRSVILDDGEDIPCDMVIAAAGVRPAVRCAENSGVDINRSINVNDYMQTSDPHIYAAGDVAGLSGIWPNAVKQGRIAAYNMCGIETAYTDTYAMKNTVSFYGLLTLSLGRGEALPGDTVVIREDTRTYKRAVIRGGRLDSVTLQGDIDYAGVFQYLIKNRVKLKTDPNDIFEESFANYYGVLADGQYAYSE